MATTLTVTDLTNVDGTGVYDKLVKANVDILDTQYKEGHIDGSAYAQLLVQLLQDTLGQASNFALKAETDAAQTALLECQAAACRKDIELKESQLLTDVEQRAKIKAEVVLLGTNNLIAIQDELLRKAQINTEIKSLDVMEADINYKNSQIAINEEQLKILAEELLIKKEEVKIRQQDYLIRVQELAIKEQQLAITVKELEIKEQELEIRIKELAKIVAEVAILEEELCSVKEKCNKIKEEINFIKEKINTENAQTNNASGGIMKSQQDLYAAQAAAFDQKHLTANRKIDADVFAVQLSMGTSADAWVRTDFSTNPGI